MDSLIQLLRGKMPLIVEPCIELSMRMSRFSVGSGDNGMEGVSRIVQRSSNFNSYSAERTFEYRSFVNSSLPPQLFLGLLEAS